MTAMKNAEEACIAHVMKAQGLDHAAAARFLHRLIATGGYQSDPELCPLVVAYKNAAKDQQHSGAAERHVQDIMETGRQAIRERSPLGGRRGGG
jgi:hypothetical protein